MDSETLEPPYPDWLSATLASDATDGRGVLPPWIRALHPGSRVFGPAFVVLACEDDNQAVRVALDGPLPAGCVLVVGGQSTSRTATVGGLMALEFQQAGVAGLVTDGLVRDSQEMRALGWPVWARGTTPTASGKRDPGTVGGAVTLGGALIRQGDLVVADDDGVVIWPQAAAAALLARAAARRDADNVRLARLLAAANRTG
ncbi:MAG TPA: RraA family protein [Chloroflexia bacterium]|nr:RraA family protein [Chloroflexia bacterium]